MVESNKMMEKLRNGQVSIGSMIRCGSPLVAEVFGYSGFDFLFIEGEHWPMNKETIEGIIRACDLTGMTSLVRIPNHDTGSVLQFLDIGASGIIVPHVDTKEQAEALMKASKYPPEGERGFSLSCRAAKYGSVPAKEYQQLANRNTVLIPMIETKEGVNNLEGILDTGVEAIICGMSDLSASFGYGGEQDHKDLQEAIQYTLDTAIKRNVPIGCAVETIEDARKRIEQGFTHIHFSSDLAMIRARSLDVLSQLKA